MNFKIMMTVAILLIAIKGQTSPSLESLYGDFFNETGVYIQVFSGGCTNKDSFVIKKEYVRGVERIYFYRVKPDLCKAYFKYGKFVNFSYEDLGLNRSDRFKIMNPRVTSRVLTVTSQASPLEALYGSVFNENGVVIQVYSGGCTHKSSFVIRKEYVSGVHKIWFYRVKPDFCEAFIKYGKFLNFSYDDLGLSAGDRFEIMNSRGVPKVY